MTAEILTSRTEAFARRIVTLCLPLLDNARSRELARHLLRAGTAANANYSSAQRGRSHGEFTARLGHAYEDVAEAKEWIDALSRVRGVIRAEDVDALRREAEELTGLLGRAYRAARGRDALAADNPIER